MKNLKIIEMANLYDTILECVTNDELLNLMDPKKIIAKTWSEFRFSRHNELVFESRDDTMHEDIISLSEKFPNEVFTAIYYEIEGYDETQVHYYRYRDGKIEFLGYIPKYTWNNYEQIIKAFGKDVFNKLWKRIRKYLYRLDQTKESILDGGLRINILENHNDQCVSSFVTVFAEHENFRMSVEKTKNSELHFRGYQRDSALEDWKEICSTVDNDVNLPF